jgi:periplasmic protein TonB
MLKHEIWQCVMGSFVLHALILIFLSRAVTVSQIHMHAMETFIFSPPSVSLPVTRQSMDHAAKVTIERRDPQTERSPSGQRHTVISVSSPVHTTHPDNSRKSEIPASEQVPEAPGPVETGAVKKAVPEPLATSRIPGKVAVDQSAETFPHGRETREEMTLGEAGAPRFIHRESPTYPFLARKLGKEGKVVLRLTLDERGRQKDLEIIEKAGFGFTEAAVQAIKKSILSPAQKDGKPVVSRVLIPVRFVLRED